MAVADLRDHSVEAWLSQGHLRELVVHCLSEDSLSVEDGVGLFLPSLQGVGVGLGASAGHLLAVKASEVVVAVGDCGIVGAVEVGHVSPEVVPVIRRVGPLKYVVRSSQSGRGIAADDDIPIVDIFSS